MALCLCGKQRSHADNAWPESDHLQVLSLSVREQRHRRQESTCDRGNSGALTFFLLTFSLSPLSFHLPHALSPTRPRLQACLVPCSPRPSLGSPPALPVSASPLLPVPPVLFLSQSVPFLFLLPLLVPHPSSPQKLRLVPMQPSQTPLPVT